MTLNPNPNIYPRDGRSFKDLDGTIHRGGTWKEVIEIVKRYRARNRMPVGNIEREVYDQFCQKNSSMCRPAEDSVQVVKQKGLTFQNRVLAHLSDLLALKKLNDRPLVDEGEVKRRAAICEKCPQRRALKISCSTCNHSMNAAKKILLGKRKSGQANFGFCNALDEDLSVTLYMDLEPEALEPLPDYCWRRKK